MPPLTQELALNDEEQTSVESPDTELDETLNDSEESPESSTDALEDGEEPEHEEAVPYDRFKEVNEKNRRLEAELEALKNPAWEPEPEPELDDDPAALSPEAYIEKLQSMLDNEELYSDFEKLQAQQEIRRTRQDIANRAQSAVVQAQRDFDTTIRGIRETVPDLSDADVSAILNEAATYGDMPVVKATKAAFVLLREEGKLAGGKAAPATGSVLRDVRLAKQGIRQSSTAPGAPRPEPPRSLDDAVDLAIAKSGIKFGG
jgi:hypothetical protein